MTINPGTLPVPWFIYIGGTFSKTVTWNTDTVGGPPVDLTGYTADMKIRQNVGNNVVIAELSTANGGIVISAPTTGVMQLILTSEQTALLAPTIEDEPAVFDLQLTATGSGGEIDFLLQGQIVIQLMNTR